MLQTIWGSIRDFVISLGSIPFVHFLLSKLREIMEMARTRYNVNPVVFLILYVVPGPFWYYTVFRTIRAIAKKNTKELMLWAMICLVLTVEPYVYVLIFGRNMPWWIYIIIGLLVAQGIFTLVRKLVKRPAKNDAALPAAADPGAQGSAAAAPPLTRPLTLLDLAATARPTPGRDIYHVAGQECQAQHAGLLWIVGQQLTERGQAYDRQHTPGNIQESLDRPKAHMVLPTCEMGDRGIAPGH